MSVIPTAASSAVLTPSRVGRDIAIVGTGSVISAIFGVLQVFLIPRLLSVEDFGYWRMFLLYVPYGGLLHLGFPDGALLGWAGKPMMELSGYVRQSLRFILVLYAFLGLPLGVLVLVIFRASIHLRLIAIAVLLTAVLLNVSTTMLAVFQAARVFKPVAITQMLPIASVVVLAVAAQRFWLPDYRQLIVFYSVGVLVGIAYMWRQASPISTVPASIVPMSFVKIGWPVLLSNAILALVQNADRVVCSSLFSIANFAQYSLAASTLMVPIYIIAASAKVFLPHFAAADRVRRPEVYAKASRLLLVAWSISLPYYVGVDFFVRHVIPQYESSLPLVRLLLLTTLFFAVIQILHATVYNLYGRQREFLRSTVLALAGALALSGAAARAFQSLPAVALAQTLAMFAWWVYGCWRLREVTGETWRDWLRTVCIFVASATILFLSVLYLPRPWMSAIAYYAVVGTLYFTVGREELIRLFQLCKSALKVSVATDPMHS